MLLVKLLLCIVPEGKMSKYIKLFSGIILIIILINPILRIQGIEDDITRTINGYDYEIDKYTLIEHTENYKNINETIAIDIYKKNIKKNIEYIVKKENVTVKSLSIVINEDPISSEYGHIISVNMSIIKGVSESNTQLVSIETIVIEDGEEESTLKSPEELILEKKIKSALINFYNMSSDNIDINIE